MEGIITSGASERSLYLKHVRYLEEQLDRCQLRCDELEKQNDHLMTRYSVLEKDKKKKEFQKYYENAREKKVDHLVQLEIQPQDAQKEREVSELQHSQDMQTLREQVDKLNTRILMRAAELEENELMLQQLKQLFSEMESLQKELKHQKKEHDAVINNLKKEAELKKRRRLKQLQDDANRRVEKETEKNLQKVRDLLRDWPQKLVTLQGVLQRYLLMKRNLLDRMNAARTKKQEIKGCINQMARRIHHHLKENGNLKKTYLDQKEELKTCNTTIQKQQGNCEVLRYELPALCEQNRQKTAVLDPLEDELLRGRNRVRLLEGVKQEAAVILRHIMTLKTQRQDQEKRAEIQWKTQRLLEILESTAP